VSAIATCSAIRTLLRSKAVEFGDAAVGRAQRGSGSSLRYSATIRSVSLPTISQNGRNALLIASEVSGATAGGQEMVYLRRIATGTWVIVGTAVLTVA
jgi:hypothetical protein